MNVLLPISFIADSRYTAVPFPFPAGIGWCLYENNFDHLDLDPVKAIEKHYRKLLADTLTIPDVVEIDIEGRDNPLVPKIPAMLRRIKKVTPGVRVCAYDYPEGPRFRQGETDPWNKPREWNQSKAVRAVMRAADFAHPSCYQECEETLVEAQARALAVVAECWATWPSKPALPQLNLKLGGHHPRVVKRTTDAYPFADPGNTKVRLAALRMMSIHRVVPGIWSDPPDLESESRTDTDEAISGLV